MIHFLYRVARRPDSGVLFALMPLAAIALVSLLLPQAWRMFFVTISTILLLFGLPWVVKIHKEAHINLSEAASSVSEKATAR